MTAEEIEARDKKRTKWLVGLMLLLLLGSTAGYAFLSGEKDSTKSNKNGIEELGGQWRANFNGQQLLFSSSPDSVNATNISLTYDLTSYYQKPVYIVSNESYINYEIASTLGLYASRIQQACYGNCTLDLPSKDCTSLLIVYNPGNESRVKQQDNCVFIEGNLSSVDAFLYRVFSLA